MSTPNLFDPFTDTWWSRIGLSAGSLVGAHPATDSSDAVHKVLLQYLPGGFFRVQDPAAPPVTAEEVRREILVEAEAQRQAQLARKKHDRDAALAKARAAEHGPESLEPVTEGSWQGFTRGRATAWCWLLFEFERRGIAHPGVQLHYASLQKLGRGELPDAFKYADRARELEERGVTPERYVGLRALLAQTPGS